MVANFTLRIPEYRYYYSELEIKHCNSFKGWTFVSASAWKNSVNAVISSVRMLLTPHALKSQNSIEKIQPRMRYASSDDNSCTTIVSCYSSTNANDETDVITFYKELSSLVLKYKVLITGEDMK